jgi:ribosomal protein S18 acetylase RimI-like enzyme
VAGGLLGETYWGWLHIAQIWLHESIRKRGYGTRLVQLAEVEAIQRGCQHAHLDTMDWQALDFYLGMGYAVFGQLNDLPAGHTRYFLQKALAASDAGSDSG